VFRPRLASLGVGLALGLLMATSGAAGQTASRSIVRWDFVQIVQGTALAGGSVQATDAATGDVITLTGSGQANVGPHARAAGGGTFVHERTVRDGHDESKEVVASGIFLVTGFVSWQRDTGTIPVVDGVGFTEQASSGILKLNVRLMPEGGSPLDGVLTIYCRLPGAMFTPVEGIDLQVGSFDFKASGGVTLFHVLT
jgi:hypothetical protein